MSLFVVNTIIIFSFLITVGLTPRTHGHIICKQYIANKRFKILRTYPLMLNLLPPSVFLMDPTISLLLFLLSFFANLFGLTAETPASVTRISVVGAVYCDTCLSNSISKHSYFLPGVDVHLQCKFRAVAPKMAEQMSFSVNRTTDKYGVYRLEIPSVDGSNCVDGMTMQSFCQATLIGTSSEVCNVPGLRTASEEISIKSKQDNLCIFSLNALSYRPLKKNASLCGDQKEKTPDPLTSSKFFLPFFPPYSFPFPFPPLPPFPSFPLPPLPPLPPVPYFPLPSCPNPPSLPFPFPPLPPFFPSPSSPPPPSTPPPPPPFSLSDPRTWIPYVSPFSPPPPLSSSSPPSPPPFSLSDPRTWIPYVSPPPPLPSPPPPFSLSDPRTWIPHVPPFSPPPPPAFDPRDPRTWIPHIPPFATPPPPAFDPRDPRTWIPHIPPFFSPPPPAFDLRDPRTWIPHFPPSPPQGLQNQKP
ncbi:formin-2-like [Cucurbita pepo subsp. pepo]|uniref:formin-2-like n=1 Tax=Cucurbita pepo subsp. pepo TaxID=3664 RepID=UPI000C9D2F6E|nr:formin-2-like [Cucurbita pepo subsp. pepo]